MQGLKGKLLVSTGGLFDWNFRHTVVLIGQHDRSGAVGVVLNRALEMTVEDTVPALGDLVPPGEALFQGGPVRPQEAVLLVEAARPGVIDVPVTGSVGFLVDEVPGDLLSDIVRARVYLGHAGWGGGQLESELDDDAWTVTEATEDDLFTDAPDTLWRRVLERMGPPWSDMARIPFDPSMN